MSGSLNISLKKLLGDNSYYSYLDDVVYPELETLVDQSKITPQELRKITESVEVKGADILNPQLHFSPVVTRNSYEKDGWIAETHNKITPDLDIRHFLKKYSSKEDFKTAVKINQSLEKALKGTKHEGQIPKHFYALSSQKISDTPCVSGTTLYEKLMQSDDVTKELILKNVIDEYVEFYKFINIPEVSKQLEFSKLKGATRFFQERYASNDRDLVRLFDENIGADLDREGTHNIHADFHATNILVNGKSTYIDWASAASNGFIEFDIGILLKKAKLGVGSEERLSRHLGSKLHDTDEGREHSYMIFTKNQISQDLVSASRYVDRAKKVNDPILKESLKNMGLINYNKAIARIKFAVAKGYVSEDFLEAIVAKPYEGLKVVDNYEELKVECDPDNSMSQYNLLPKNIENSELYNTKKNLSSIKKNIFRDKSKNLWNKVSRVLALTGLIGVATSVAYIKFQESQSLKKDIEWRRVMDEESYGLSLYQSMLSYPFKQAAGRMAEGTMTERLSRVDPVVDSIAKQYDIPADILRNMMDVSKHFGGFYNTYSSREALLNGLTIIDPISAMMRRDSIIHGGPSKYRDVYGDVSEEGCLKYLNMHQNLVDGASRLHNYIVDEDKKMKIEPQWKNLNTIADHKAYADTLYKHALMKFFFPYKKTQEKYSNKEVYQTPYGTLEETQLGRIRDAVKQLTYSSMYGLSSAFDGGTRGVFMSPTPEGF